MLDKLGETKAEVKVFSPEMPHLLLGGMSRSANTWSTLKGELDSCPRLKLSNYYT